MFRSQAAIVFQKLNVFTFFYRRVSKFYLAVKKGKVNQWSSFEKSMMGWSFVEIGQMVLKKSFERFSNLTYMGMATILVM